MYPLAVVPSVSGLPSPANICSRKVPAAKRMWPRLAMRIKHLFGTGEKEMASAMIEDYPSLEYRGLMVISARSKLTGSTEPSAITAWKPSGE